MRKRRYSLTVRGKRGYWGFEVRADPRFVEMWRADGIEITEIEKTERDPLLFRIAYHLVRGWRFLRRSFHLKSPANPA